MGVPWAGQEGYIIQEIVCIIAKILIYAYKYWISAIIIGFLAHQATPQCVETLVFQFFFVFSMVQLCFWEGVFGFFVFFWFLQAFGLVTTYHSSLECECSSSFSQLLWLCLWAQLPCNYLVQDVCYIRNSNTCTGTQNTQGCNSKNEDQPVEHIKQNKK